MKRKLLLLLWAFFLIAPGLSFTLKAVLAQSASDSDTVASNPEPSRGRPIVYVMEIEGAIGTVTNDRIREAIGEATGANAELLVIELDTPGGFSNATQMINKNILNSDVPVCVYIYPSGSRAGSAGVYITYAANFAAMAPSTNIGAAHPVGGGGQEVDSIMNEKVTNDAVAQIKAAADKRGRNAEWAEKAVRESVSITDREALEMNVINYRAQDLDDLLAKIDGDTTEVADGREVVMDLKDPIVRTIEQSWKQKILGILSSPDIAFILLSIGSLGIVLELYNPGSIFPGVVGAICLILAFYSLQTLPINYAGVALILLSVVLFIAEIKIPSAGLLTVGGVVSLFLGGLMLVDSVNPALRVSWTVLITTVVLIGITVSVVLYFVVRAHRAKVTTGNEGLIGMEAEVKAGGLVYVSGALWKVDADTDLNPGDRVEITEVHGLRLKVRRITT